MNIENVLNEIEKNEVSKFVENKVQLEAVKKVILFGLYFNGTLQPGEEADPTKNFLLALVFNKSISNELLGADLRGCGEGIRIVENGFKELEQFRVLKKEPRDEKNPGR